MTTSNEALTGHWLVDAWVQAKKDGISMAQFGESLGMSLNQVRGRIDRARSSKKNSSIPPDLGVKTEIKQNYMELESGYNKRIVTLEDLLAAAKVDLDRWIVDRYIINKWEVGAKTAKRDLTWQDGQIIDGYIRDEGVLTIEPLIQVKAWLVRKEPVAITPVIQPIELSVKALTGGSRKRASAPKQSGWKRALILPDPQFGFSRNERGHFMPFHSREALSVALEVARSNVFDRVIVLGDVLDLPDWSDKYTREPQFYFNTQASIMEATWWLTQFRAALPDAEFDMLEGNHDKRLRDALSRHLVFAHGLRPSTEIEAPPSMSIERLLSLDALNIEWHGGYPNNEIWLNDRLQVIHGELVRGPAGATSSAVIAGVSHSVIYGHIHRIERATRTLNGRDGGRTITAVSPGCLCDTNFVVPGHSPKTNTGGWQNGIGVAYYHLNGDHFVETHEIYNDRMIYGGELIEAVDHLEAIRKDTGWNL